MRLYSRPRPILRATLYSSPAPAVHPFRHSSKEKLSGPTVSRPATSTHAPAQPAFAYTSHCPAATPSRPVMVAIRLTSVLYVTVGDLRLRKSSLNVSPLSVASAPTTTAKLLIVADLAAGDESSGIIVDPLASEIDARPV